MPQMQVSDVYLEQLSLINNQQPKNVFMLPYIWYATHSSVKHFYVDFV